MKDSHQTPTFGRDVGTTGWSEFHAHASETRDTMDRRANRDDMEDETRN